jgi:hypothetical protein
MMGGRCQEAKAIKEKQQQDNIAETEGQQLDTVVINEPMDTCENEDSVVNNPADVEMEIDPIMFYDLICPFCLEDRSRFHICNYNICKNCDTIVSQSLASMHSDNFLIYGNCFQYMNCSRCTLPLITKCFDVVSFVLYHSIFCTEEDDGSFQKCFGCKNYINPKLYDYHIKYCGIGEYTEQMKIKSRIRENLIMRKINNHRPRVSIIQDPPNGLNGLFGCYNCGMALRDKTKLKKHIENEYCVYAVCTCHGQIFTNKHSMKDHKDTQRIKNIFEISKKHTNFKEHGLIPAWFGNNTLALALDKIGNKKFNGKKQYQ